MGFGDGSDTSSVLQIYQDEDREKKLITVCIPTFNGAKYIREQMESILVSPLVKEILVADDGSADDTVAIVESCKDTRIKIFEGPGAGVVNNYEFLLGKATGRYVFLADQDDVWFPNKVAVLVERLHKADLVVCDCAITDAELNVVYPSFFALRKSRSGIVKNMFRNSYLGCCIAFKRDLLKHALPFPPNLPMHDWWLGMIAEVFGRVEFVDQPLMLYRRHGKNASQTTESSSSGYKKRISWRANMVIALIRRRMSLG
jgi:glycosyltransferase involved in cell wall biosynthesis